MTRRISIADGIVVIGIGIICLPVFLMLMPNIESSRSEARLLIAHNEVRRLHQSLVKVDDSESVTTLTDLDPWGQPYRVALIDGRQIRVLSSGPNMSFSPNGIDDDDIYSDMPAPPFEVIVARKHRQILIAMAATFGLWISLTTAYLWWR